MVSVLSDLFELHTESKEYVLIGINNIKQICSKKTKFSSLRVSKY